MQIGNLGIVRCIMQCAMLNNILTPYCVNVHQKLVGQKPRAHVNTNKKTQINPYA